MESQKRKNFTAAVTFFGAVCSAFGVAVKLIPEGLSPDWFPKVGPFVGLLGLVSFLGGIVITLRYLPDDVQDQVEKAVNEEVFERMTTMAAIGLSDNLRKVVAKPEVIANSLRKGQDLVVRIVGEVVLDFISRDVTHYVDQLERFQKDGAPLKLEHTTAVYGTLKNVLEEIPEGSCWLGITHIGSEIGWSNPAIVDFQQLSARKARSDRVNMFRIYVTTREKLDGLRRVMKRETDAKIITRYIIVESEDQRSSYPDVSIIWTPSSSQAQLKIEDFRDSDPVLRLTTAPYKPLCTLNFMAHHMSLLAEVTISTPERNRDRFDSNVESFTQAWAEAQPFDGAQGPSSARPLN